MIVVNDAKNLTNHWLDCSARGRFLFWIVPIALFVLFFLPSFSPDARFSYRDSAFYYYPLFQQIQREWEAGRAPLWNPYVNLGQPLAADPTSSIFYPLKAIFFLSSFKLVSFGQCFKIYVWFHVVLAFLLSRRLARRLGVSDTGALFSACAYAFSGQILFQYSNVIYLVGGAWAPELISSTVDFYKSPTLKQKIKKILNLSAVQALVILGGEPQIVYLTMLASIVGLLFAPIQTTSNNSRKPFLSFMTKRKRIVIALVFATSTFATTFCLSAAQVLPSLEMVRNSTRTSETATITESYRPLLFANAGSDKTVSNVYRFSVAPWRWSEFLFPNVGGRQFPISTRWFSALPEEIAIWTPTLYFGAFPFLLAISSARLRRGKNPQEKLRVGATLLVVFSLLSAMGGFGLVWLGRTVASLCSGQTISNTFANGDPIGGVYWFLTLVLPKFAAFRYPAKLLTLAMLGFSYLVGAGWDEQINTRRFRNLLFISVGLGAIGLFVALFGGFSFLYSIKYRDPLFGPFQARAAELVVRLSFFQTAFVLTTSFIILKQGQRERYRGNPKASFFTILALLTITSADLYLANRWTIAVSPSSLFERPSDFANQIKTKRNKKMRALQPRLSDQDSSVFFNSIPPTRVYRFPVWFPPLFANRSSQNRITERVIWDTETLFPLAPAEDSIALLDERGAFMERNYERFINAELNGTNATEELCFLDTTAVLGPRFWVDHLLSDPEEKDCSVDASKIDWSVSLRNLEGSPARAAIYREKRRVDNPSLLAKRESQIDSPLDYIEPLISTPNSNLYLVSSSANSEIIFAEQYWNDWFAKSFPISSKQAEEFREARFSEKATNKLLKRLVQKTPGQTTKLDREQGFLRKMKFSQQGLFVIKTEYRPQKVIIGILVSGISWIIFSVFVFFPLRGSRANCVPQALSGTATSDVTNNCRNRQTPSRPISLNDNSQNARERTKDRQRD